MAPKSKNARAVALKHLDLYKKWKAAIMPAPASAHTSSTSGPASAEDSKPLGESSGLKLNALGLEVPVDDSRRGAEVDEQEAAKADADGLLQLTQQDELVNDGHATENNAAAERRKAATLASSSASSSSSTSTSSVVEQLFHSAMTTLIPLLTTELDLQEEGILRAKAFLNDRATLFRFYRRSRYNFSTALEMLHTSLSWRLKTSLDLLSLNTLHPLYVNGTASGDDGEEKPRNDDDAEDGEKGSRQGRSKAQSGTPLFWLSNRFIDKFGRPCGVISLRSLERVSPDGQDDSQADRERSENFGGNGTRGLDEVKEYIVASMEITRKYLEDVYRRSIKERGGIDAIVEAIRSEDSGEDEDAEMEEAERNCPPLQMSIAFDLASSGMANLELELLPFLLDLLKNHFPGMVGAVYILHFSWLHSGMWAVAKRVLPQQALARIFFPNDTEMREEHFAPQRLPRPFGGDWNVRISPESNETMRKYGRSRKFARGLSMASAAASRNASRAQSLVNTPLASPTTTKMPLGQGFEGNRSLSRNQSFESIYDVFYSADVTPWASRHGTPRPSQPSTPGGEHAPSSRAGAWRMTPGASRKLKSLQMSRGDSNEAAASSKARKRALSDPRAVERRERRASADISNFSSGAAASGESYFPADPEKTPRRRSRALSNASSVGIVRSRIGGGTRDFQLYLPEKDRSKATQDGDEDVDSDSSGKAGERRDSNATVTEDNAERGFFARWRKKSPTVNQEPFTNEESTHAPLSPTDEWNKELQDRRRKAQHISGVNSTRSPRMSPTQRFDALVDERGNFYEALQQGAERDDGGDPDSPQLQVFDINEPPLSGKHPFQPPRFISVNRSRKYAGPGQVSPYNADNPFFGYPAYIAPLLPSGSRPSSARKSSRFDLSDATPRHLHARRRKRDLIRTLAYLFFLRILAAHRNVRWRLRMFWREWAAAFATQRSGPGVISGNTREHDMLWKRDQEQRAHSKAMEPTFRRLLLRKRLLIVIVLLAALHSGWRAGLLEWIHSNSGKTAAAETGGKPAYRASSRSTTSTGLHVRKRLGLTS